MRRRVGAKREGRASAGRKRGSFPEAARAQGGGGGGGGGGGSGGGLPIWRRPLTSPEDVAQLARGGNGERRKRRKRRAGPHARGPSANDSLPGPGVSAGARALLASLRRPACRPPPAMCLHRPPPSSRREEPELEPETGKAPIRVAGSGAPRRWAPLGLQLRPSRPTPPSEALASGGMAQTRPGIRGPHGTEEGRCRSPIGRGEGALSPHSLTLPKEQVHLSGLKGNFKCFLGVLLYEKRGRTN